MTTQNNHRIVRELIKHAIGGAADNLYRAEHAFKGLLPIEMQKQHGQSGQTRQEVVDTYRDHKNELDSVLEWYDKEVKP